MRKAGSARKPEQWGDEFWEGPSLKGPHSAAALALKDGETHRDLELDLSKSVVAGEGRVVAADGKPVTDALVQLYWSPDGVSSLTDAHRTIWGFAVLSAGGPDRAFDPWNTFPRRIACDPVTTDADGRYRLKGLPTGGWMLTAGALFPTFGDDDNVFGRALAGWNCTIRCLGCGT